MLSVQFEPIINSKFQALRPSFVGVFSFDHIPTVLPDNKFIICNTDTSENRGKHWFAIYNNGPIVEIFDSLGTNEEFIKKLPKLGNCIEFNSTPVQSKESINCGLYSLFWACNRLYNLDLTYEEIINFIFSKDLTSNEKKVTQYFKDGY